MLTIVQLSAAVGSNSKPNTEYPQVFWEFNLAIVWPPAKVIVGATVSCTVKV